MTIKEYQRAVNSFSPDAGMKDRIAAAVAEGRRPVGRPVGRVLAGAMAAAVLLVCTMGVAMAASPTFRSAVLAFFHIEEREQPPAPTLPQDDPLVTQGEIGGAVKAQYVQLENAAGYSTGNGTLFQTERDELGNALDARFWAVEDGALKELERRTTTFTAVWEDRTYSGTFWWCVRDGEVTCYSDNRSANLHEYVWDVRAIPGRNDAVLLTVSWGSQFYYRGHPFLCHLDTGETEDLLAGVDLSPIGRVIGWKFSADLTRAILLDGDGFENGGVNSGPWFADRTAGTLTTLEALVGFKPSTAFFADNDTLVLLEEAGPQQELYNAYVYDLVTGTLTQTVREAGGLELLSGRFVPEVAADGTVQVLDLATGTRTAVEGFTVALDGDFIANGARLLYYRWEVALDSSIAELGVLDLERGTFISFDREAISDGSDFSLGWFDDRRVKVWASSADGRALALYLYEF